MLVLQTGCEIALLCWFLFYKHDLEGFIVTVMVVYGNHNGNDQDGSIWKS